MAFYIGILLAVGFAYSAIKLGFYHAWTLLFNVLIAVYLAVRLGPLVEEFVPASGQYGKTMAVLATSVGTFLILHWISYTLLLGQFEVTFPRVFNTFVAGLFGFVTGLLVWSFVMFVICTTPFCQNAFVKDIGFSSKQFEESKMQPYLVWWCNFADKFAASGSSQAGTGQAIKGLIYSPPVKTEIEEQAIKPADVNVPAEPGSAEGLGSMQRDIRRYEPNNQQSSLNTTQTQPNILP